MEYGKFLEFYKDKSLILLAVYGDGNATDSTNHSTTLWDKLSKQPILNSFSEVFSWNEFPSPFQLKNFNHIISQLCPSRNIVHNPPTKLHQVVKINLITKILH